MTAKEEKTFLKLTIQLVQVEERRHLIENLKQQKLGLREEEEFVKHEMEKMRGGGRFGKKDEIIKLLMEEKLRDNNRIDQKLRRHRNKVRKKLVDMYGEKSHRFKSIMDNIRKKRDRMRDKLKQKNIKKVKFLRNKYGRNVNVLEGLNEDDKKTYGEAKIFCENEVEMTAQPSEEPMVVKFEDEEITINEDEKNFLKLGPKFCIFKNLTEEDFEVELEQAIVKYRWEVMGEEKENKKRNLNDVAIEAIQDDDEKAECKEYDEMMMGKTRMVFDRQSVTLDFTKRRVTDLKGNSHVTLPKAGGNFNMEAKLEALRTEAMGVNSRYLEENCGKGGRQKTNLNSSQVKGMKSLLKRVKDGEIMVVPTDKTSKLAVMSRAAYIKAGLAHTVGDKEVGWVELKEAQSELNGHVAMLIKVFKMGKNWKHESRIRDTMMGQNLSVCPITLLLKDHKGWSPKDGGVPPTRQVAGGHLGMNLHLSEIVSDIIEPLVGVLEGGREVISCEDLTARLEKVNLKNENWNPYSWWEGKTAGEYIACSKCIGKIFPTYDTMGEIPDLCSCEQEPLEQETQVTLPDGKGNTMETEIGGHGDTDNRSQGNKSYEIEAQCLPQLWEGKFDIEPESGGGHGGTGNRSQGSLGGPDLEVQCNPQYLPQSWEGNNTKESEVEGRGDTGNRSQGSQDGPDLEVQCNLQPGEGNTDMEPAECNPQSEGNNTTEPGPVEKGGNDGVKTKKATISFCRRLRRKLWEDRMGWEGNKFRLINSSDSLPEDLQDYTKPMVIIGSDVVSLYPSMVIDKVVVMVQQGILKSGVKWEDVDYLEAVRYLALNMTAKECQESNLRRCLPTRRRRGGTRPGVKGAGPKGRVRGDQEQWEFPNIVLEEWEKKEIMMRVVGLATKTMFEKHYYEFDGRKFHQEEGGPIGLRGTCAVARFMMQLVDKKWEDMLVEMKVAIEEIMRYVDDGRILMYAFKAGWRWWEGGIWFCEQWREEDSLLSPTQITSRIIGGTLERVEDFLKFTVETGEDFNGWLPTLDTSIMVGEDNRIRFKFYEKQVGAKQTVQQRSAMGEDSKMQILSNDLVRRLSNCSLDIEAEERRNIVDNYAQKLLNSGFSREQTRRILIGGIKGFGAKVKRCLKEGRSLWRTAEDSRGSREMKSLLGRASWYKKKKDKKDWYREEHNKKGAKNEKRKEEMIKERIPHKSVMFVEQTVGGSLASKLRELIDHLAPILGFSVKIVERTGSSIKSLFSQDLYKGEKCGRGAECITCSQPTDKAPPCTRPSLVYENVCLACNPGVEPGKKWEQKDEGEPSLYVGETSRSIQERSKEHWSGLRSKSEKNHIWKHQMLAHGGSQEPNFLMMPVKYHRTALARQVGEAVRIRRRGGEGALLNSKGEYNRSHIPRLTIQVDQPSEGAISGWEEDQQRKEREQGADLERWKWSKTRERNIKELSTIGGHKKRGEETCREPNTRGEKQSVEGSRKKFKYDRLGEDWGDTLCVAPKGSPTQLAGSPGGPLVAQNEDPPPSLAGKDEFDPAGSQLLLPVDDPPEGNCSGRSHNVVEDKGIGDHPTTINSDQKSKGETPWWKKKKKKEVDEGRKPSTKKIKTKNGPPATPSSGKIDKQKKRKGTQLTKLGGGISGTLQLIMKSTEDENKKGVTAKQVGDEKLLYLEEEMMSVNVLHDGVSSRDSMNRILQNMNDKEDTRYEYEYDCENVKTSLICMNNQNIPDDVKVPDKPTVTCLDNTVGITE